MKRKAAVLASLLMAGILWAGCVDDLWKIGKAVGHGATWKKTAVRANEASLPYLMNGFDKKSLTLTNHSGPAAAVTVQVDITGAGVWKTYRTFEVAANGKVEYDFPDAFQAYWVRTTSNADAMLSAEFLYK